MKKVFGDRVPVGEAVGFVEDQGGVQGHLLVEFCRYYKLGLFRWFVHKLLNRTLMLL